MPAAYLRDLEHAKRDVIELHDLLVAYSDGRPALTRLQLMTAIGLASEMHDALLRAAWRQTEGDAE